MNKIIYSQSGIVLTTGDTFVETSTITIPSVSGGLLVCRISCVGRNASFETYTCEMVAGFNKDDNGTLNILTTEYLFEGSNILATPSYVINSNNLRIRFTRNGHSDDTYWIADLDIYYINN